MRIPLRTDAEIYDVALKGTGTGRQTSIVEGGGGDGIYNAIARVFATIQDRLAARLEATYWREADFGQKATGSVVWTYTIAPGAEARLLAGSVLLGLGWGLRVVLAEDAVFPAGAGGALTLAVESEAALVDANTSHELDYSPAFENLTDPHVELLWSSTTDQVDADALVADVLAATGSIEVISPGLAGGVEATLDMLGLERNEGPAEGETALAFMSRVRRSPRGATPAEIEVEADDYLFRYGLSGAVVVEPWEGDGCFAIGDGAIGDDAFWRPWSFYLTVPTAAYANPGFAIGDGAIGDDPLGSLDEARAALYAGLRALVQRIKIGGVYAQVVEV